MNSFRLSEKRKKLFDYLKKHYPKSFSEIEKKNLIGPHFFSPFLLELPQSVFIQAEKFIKSIYKIKESQNYKFRLPDDRNWKTWPETPSVLTCFDFHYSEKTGLKLIEINTNASLYISHYVFLDAQGQTSPDPEMGSLLKSFKKGLSLKSGDSVFILDREPEKEGLYFEFLLFQEWLEKQGYKVDILSLDKYKTKRIEFPEIPFSEKIDKNRSFKFQSIQKIYNRFTDFYFSKPESEVLMNDYVSKKVIFSPNPREYFFLSDKKRQRLLRAELKIQNPGLVEIIPQSKLFSEFESQDALWRERKKYFFKPSQSFGGKGAFKGQNISRKMFNEIYSSDFMAQELCPAGQRIFNCGETSVKLKFDLRFHIFEGEIQNYLARFYQGQTMNVKTEWGGVAPLCFS